MKPATCPHCGRELDTHSRHHVNVCLQRPGVRDLVRELMERPDAPGVALSFREYSEVSIAHNAQTGFGLRAPSFDALRKAFGTWRKVCEWAGLIYMRQPRAGREAEAIAEVAAEVEAVQRAMEAEHARRQGLAVLSMREIDGGRRVAYLLR